MRNRYGVLFVSVSLFAVFSLSSPAYANTLATIGGDINVGLIVSQAPSGFELLFAVGPHETSSVSDPQMIVLFDEFIHPSNDPQTFVLSAGDLNFSAAAALLAPAFFVPHYWDDIPRQELDYRTNPESPHWAQTYGVYQVGLFWPGAQIDSIVIVVNPFQYEYYMDAWWPIDPSASGSWFGERLVSVSATSYGDSQGYPQPIIREEIPEPTSLLLLSTGIGVIGLIGYGWRRIRN